MTETPDGVERAVLALRLLALDPGLGGLHLRARAGPVRDRLLAPLAGWTRITPATPDDALTGALDLAATLAAGRPVMRPGLLAAAGPVVLTMAERAPRALTARLGQAVDRGAALVLLDEGVEDEAPPAALTERMAFRADLNDCPLSAARQPDLKVGSPGAVALPEGAAQAVAALCAQLGIDSARAPLLALRAMRALAALDGRDRATEQDMAHAAALVLAHRATRLPEPEAETDDPPPETQAEPEDSLSIPQEMLLDAVRAALPDGLLALMAARAARGARGAGSGAVKLGNRRGRPLPARPGRPRDGARIDLVATLRAAAPWQRLRRQAEPGARPGPLIRPADLHLKRFEDRSDRLLVFAVDASGSAALARLGEAKGAVELLLAQAYARRDHVALVAFRGTGAETLLPATRSLVQTKRRLAALPGGGATPLAAGLATALDQAQAARRRGLTPTLCLLTDGRANIALDGRADRVQAGRDATRLALAWRWAGLDALVIDTGARPEPQLRQLAQTLAAPYLPLPRADAKRLAAAVSTVLA